MGLNPRRGRSRLSSRSLLVSLALVCASFGVSDSASALPMAWDIRFGPSLMGVTGELADSLDRPSLGLDGGLSIRWPSSKSPFSIQGDFLLAARSRSFEDDIGSGTPFRRSLRVLYAQVPLL